MASFGAARGTKAPDNNALTRVDAQLDRLALCDPQ